MKHRKTEKRGGFKRLPFLILIVTAAAFSAFLLLRYLQAGKFKEAVEKIPMKYNIELVKDFPFSTENSLKEWEEKIFKDKVVYRIENDQTLSYVRATSKAAASALYYRIKLDAKRGNPTISWKWRVEKFPVKKLPESLDTESEDDFAARVYVIFPAMFFTNWKVLEYVWAESLPVGVTGTSPYSNNIKLIVAASGAAKDGWLSEERDIIADYMTVFGRRPEYDIGAVAFMTNTEHTGSDAAAMYDDISIGYKKDGGAAKGGKSG